MPQGAVIGCAQVTIRLPGCHSLKEKRQVLGGLLRRTRTRFQVAVAEVSEQDKWQLAGVGIVCISSERSHADRMLAAALEFFREGEGDYQVAEIATELISV
ncbi:MAG: DUF503 domain-containing protein [Candidatus Dormibacteraceae bacterium]